MHTAGTMRNFEHCCGAILNMKMMNVVNTPLVFIDYFVWHYTAAFRDLAMIGLNFLWFTGHFFSVASLARTLFAPWKRIREPYRPEGIENFFATIVFNTISRIIGALIRLTVIAMGAACFVAVLAVTLVALVVWAVLPLLTVVILFTGVTRLV